MTGRATRDPRLERTEATVLAAVRRLLDAEGPQAVTFGRVSREAGVSRTTLYRHWAGPSELLADAWAQVVPPNVVARSPDLRADLIDLFLGVRDVVESVTMRRSLPALLAAAHDDPVIAALHAEFVRDRRRPIVERLVEARRAGDLAPHADPDLLVDLRGAGTPRLGAGAVLRVGRTGPLPVRHHRSANVGKGASACSREATSTSPPAPPATERPSTVTMAPGGSRRRRSGVRGCGVAGSWR